MILSMAPMEGVTGHVFRKVHAECFGKMERYYTPFISPTRVGIELTRKSMRELSPEYNAGLNVIPQLLSKNAEEFLWATDQLERMGYKEVNLNLGCPSGTVTSKGKGSGALADLIALEAFLREICERSPLPVSVKTRLGVTSDAEYEELLELYCSLPLAELIVHPRVQKDMYKGHARREVYGTTLARAPFPVAYNGDIFTVEDYESLLAAYPATSHVMIGRGLVANPALPRMIGEGAPAALDELREFHDALFCAYEEEIGGNAVWRMKEWWSYAKDLLPEPERAVRAIRKAKNPADYRTAAERVFAAAER
jgi:tRNA-dihydrouridine synthase